MTAVFPTALPYARWEGLFCVPLCEDQCSYVRRAVYSLTSLCWLGGDDPLAWGCVPLIALVGRRAEQFWLFWSCVPWSTPKNGGQHPALYPVLMALCCGGEKEGEERKGLAPSGLGCSTSSLPSQKAEENVAPIIIIVGFITAGL